MKISFSTIPGNLTTSNGYGQAGYGMVRSLQRLGHQVPFQDEKASVQIHFSQPEWYDFYPDQYKVGYTPWESTGLPVGWLDEFNGLDELWTPSPLVADWYREAGVNVPTRVYEHGIDHDWTRKRRHAQTKIKFLHVGEPAPRKGGEMALQAFRDAFGDRDDVHLTIKAHKMSTARYRGRDGSIICPVEDLNNVSLDIRDLPDDQMISLFRSHHALVYPGWGEGFGLIPLQAMATGMPTICTSAWAPYQRYILPELSLSSTLVSSPWQQMHPGKMFKPDYDELVSMYLTVADHFDVLAGKAFKNSFGVHTDYDWDTLTESAFRHIVEKFS